jgi:hypothetical protein
LRQNLASFAYASFSILRRNFRSDFALGLLVSTMSDPLPELAFRLHEKSPSPCRRPIAYTSSNSVCRNNRERSFLDKVPTATSVVLLDVSVGLIEEFILSVELVLEG